MKRTESHHRTRVGQATLDYIYKRPKNLESPRPKLFVPGYGGVKPAYEELSEEVLENGFAVVIFRPPRSQKKFAFMHPKHFLHPERLLAQSVVAISKDLVKKHGDQDGFSQVDSIGHSMGGPAGVRAGLVHPELFDSVIVMASAGLDGHNLLDMWDRAPEVLEFEVLPVLWYMLSRKSFRTALDMGHYIARSPWRTLAEGLAVGSGDIKESVSSLGSLGVKTAAMQFESDKFFPLSGVQEHSGDRFDTFDVFPDPEANHMWPLLHPRAVADELIVIFDALDSRRKLAA